MNKKNYRDIIISLLLLSTLGMAGFLVSCSEDGGLLIGPLTGTNGNHFNVEDTQSSYISGFFGGIEDGATGEIGSDLTGWVFGAMGLAGSSPNYTHQLNLIIEQLDSMVVLLNGIEYELTQIEQTLLNINCSEQASDLQEEIATLDQLYLTYNSIVKAADSGFVVSDTVLQDWANKVLNGYAQNNDVGTILSSFKANVGQTTGAIHTCVEALGKPDRYSFGQDTSYYNNVDAITNYYFYYQAIGLAMYSEANHYEAWVAAGRPNDSTLSTDSIQAVCNANGTANIYCNEVKSKTNDLYNTLLNQMTYGGAGYTGDDLVLQYDSVKILIWVKSLEAFTSASGSTCTSPLTNTNLCGPTIGYYYTKLGDTVYDQASGFRFASSSDLYTLIDVNRASQYSSNGQYLETQGFKNMSNKTVISTDSIQFKLPKSNHHTSSVPFFNTDIPPVINYGGVLTSVFRSSDDFGYVLHPNKVSSFTCGKFMGYEGKEYHYNYASALGAKDPWIIAYAKDATCSDGSYPTSFEFTNSGFGSGSFPGPPSYWPGWLTNAQYPHTGIETRRFLWPVLYGFQANCTNNRAPVNPGKMATRCGDDFTAFLNLNVPRPPTCNNPGISPLCTVMN